MKKTLITILSLSSLLVFSSVYAQTKIVEESATSTIEAEVATTTPPLTPLQLFTLCSQDAIEKRDNTIASSRATYNSMMNSALSSRKDAEKAAVSMEDEDEKKDFLRKAADSYKKEVNTAQGNLSSARKEAWVTFEAGIKHCRDIRDGKVDPDEEKDKSANKSEVKDEKKEDDNKSLGESIKEKVSAIIDFFKRK